MRVKLRVMLTPISVADLDIFQRLREDATARLSEHFRRLQPIRHDQALVFDGLEPTQVAEIEDWSRRTGLEPSFTPAPVYTDDEIRSAAYVPLLTKGEAIGMDEDGEPLIRYPTRTCDACDAPDLTAPPESFVVQKPKRTNGLSVWTACNGVRVVTRALWSELAPEIEPWVRTGPIVDPDGNTADELVWVMPKFSIGPYVDRKVIRACERCGQPLEIRGWFFKDPLLRDLRIVESKRAHRAPISLVGNWFGSLRRGVPHVTWDVVISGLLHEKLCNLRVRGHVRAEQVINIWEDLPQSFMARTR